MKGNLDFSMETKSLRKAARVFVASADIKSSKATSYVETVFIAGAAWAWARVNDDIAKHKKTAADIFNLLNPPQ